MSDGIRELPGAHRRNSLEPAGDLSSQDIIEALGLGFYLGRHSRGTDRDVLLQARRYLDLYLEQMPGGHLDGNGSGGDIWGPTR